MLSRPSTLPDTVLLEEVVQLPHTLHKTLGEVAEGAGKRYEGFRGGPFEVKSRMSRGRSGKEEDGSGGQVEPSHFSYGFLSGFCGG